jgi:hypothetical protein
MARRNVGCDWYGSIKEVDFTHEHHRGQWNARKDANETVLITERHRRDVWGDRNGRRTRMAAFS